LTTQRRELTDACDRRGWQVIAKFCDEGVSGAKGATSAGISTTAQGRYQFDIVAAWSVDRLGHRLQDLVGVLG
jgi:DNA invertase Pin-like site-specific DNA recombinase